MKSLFPPTPDIAMPRALRTRNPLRAHVMIDAAPEALDSLSVELAGVPELRRLICVAGDFGLIADLEAASPERLDAALDRIGHMRGVRRTTSSIVLSMKLTR